MANIKHNQNQCLKEFGLSINGCFEEIDARILKPPILYYANNETPKVSNGCWRTGRTFDKPAKLISENDSWTIVNFTKTNIFEFQKQFIQEG